MKKNILILTLASLVVGTQVQAADTQQNWLRLVVPTVATAGICYYVYNNWFTSNTPEAVVEDTEVVEAPVVEGTDLKFQGQLVGGVLVLPKPDPKRIAVDSRAAAGFEGVGSLDVQEQLARSMADKLTQRNKDKALQESRAFATELVDQGHAGGAPQCRVESVPEKPALAPKPNLSVKDRIARFDRKNKS